MYGALSRELFLILDMSRLHGDLDQSLLLTTGRYTPLFLGETPPIANIPAISSW